MKLQHLMIIFAIIFLPIIIITSYYIQKQVDTIDLQLSYDSKLLDATYDALSAFEINTANEDLSTVADSLRSILEASNNIFFNTLATNMGISNASKSYIQPYIPAILYTLYDGYYIYSPTSTPIVCTDSYGNTIDTSSYGVRYVGEMEDPETSQKMGYYIFDEDEVDYTDSVATGASTGYTVDYENDLPNYLKEEYGQLLYQNKGTITIEGKTYNTYSTVLHDESNKGTGYTTKYTKSYMLKSYVSYTANYATDDGNIDVTINYTLDNYISITGTIGGVYYTKSGYLIEDGLVKSVSVDGSSIDPIEWYTYSEEEIEDLIDSGATVTVTLDETNTTNSSITSTTISTSESTNSSTVDQDIDDAVKYYVEAWMFSSWVYENLGELTEANITSSYGSTIADLNGSTELDSSLMYNFEGSDTVIFSGDPEDSESNFAEHKRNVIKNSIMYNLALSMVTYSQMSSLSEYDLLIISEEEWDSILTNVSMVTFMQGLSCGLKYYNNYAIATSTNNEITVTPSEIYYVPVEETEYELDTNGDGLGDEDVYTDITDSYYSSKETAHRIDCEDLDDVEYYISFKSKDIKYDKIYDSTLGVYTYDHKAYLDYTCIVNGNYWVYNDTGQIKYRGNFDLETNLYTIGSASRLKAYRIAVAKERNNLYKSLEYETNYGWEIVYINESGETVGNSGSISTSASRDISEIYKVEVTFSDTDIITSGYRTVNMSVTLSTGSTGITSDKSVITETSSNEYTREFNISGGSDSLSKIIFNFTSTSTSDESSVETSIKVKSIKIYYK